MLYFSELPTEDAQSNIYVIFTKDSLADEEFTGLHSIKYRADLTLPGFAKWLMLLSLPRMVRKIDTFLPHGLFCPSKLNQTLSHLSVHVVNHLLRKNRKSIPNIFNGKNFSKM